MLLNLKTRERRGPVAAVGAAAETGGRGGLKMVRCATEAEAGGRRSTTEEVVAVLLNLKTRERRGAAAAVV